MPPAVNSKCYCDLICVLSVVVQPSPASSLPVSESCSLNTEDDCNDADVLKAANTAAEVSLATISVGLFRHLICKLFCSAF